MTKKNFELYVSFSQIAVFGSHLKQPFNDWTDQQVLQGFSWRVGSVSFRTMVEEGTHRINFIVSRHMPPKSSNAVRSIDVQFESPPDGNIEIASISDTIPISLAAGKYLLRCEFLRPDSSATQVVNLIFINA